MHSCHSKRPEIIEMRTNTAYKMVEELRKLCASYELPEQIVSDNGPQFVSEEFATFTKRNGINTSKVHHTIPPQMEQLNG